MTRDRVFIVSLIFSFLIHLSMVTIFRIVIYFPREDIQYYALDIIDAGSRQSVLSSRWSVLRTPSPDDALAEHFSTGAEGGLAADGAPYMPAWDDLPDIELPTIEFAELGRLRLAERGEALGAHLDELLDLEPRDPWARFTEELESIGGALSRLTFGDREPASEEEKPSPIARPAAGFEAYIEWMSAPKDRRLLSAPPIRALWGVDPKTFSGNIVLAFKVNPEGKVIEVLNPVLDDNEIVTGAGLALTRYRFEPLADAEAGDQQGMLYIRPADQE